MEDQILNKVALEQCLSRLHPADATMLLMMYRISAPDDYEGPWPPSIKDVAEYIGIKYEGGKPLSEATMRYRVKVLRMEYQGLRGALRRG